MSLVVHNIDVVITHLTLIVLFVPTFSSIVSYWCIEIWNYKQNNKTWQWATIKETTKLRTDHYYLRPTMIPSIACSCPVLYPLPMFTSAHVHSHISTEDDPCECDQTHLAAHNPTIRRYHARYVRPSSYNTPLTQTLNSKSLLHPPPYPISWHSTHHANAIFWPNTSVSQNYYAANIQYTGDCVHFLSVFLDINCLSAVFKCCDLKTVARMFHWIRMLFCVISADWPGW